MSIFKHVTKRIFVFWLAGWVSLAMPGFAFAQETTSDTTQESATENTTGPTEPTGITEPTGATEPTGPQTCTGAGCTQGLNQGFDQGTDQGGPTLQQLGATQNESGEWVLPEGVANTTKGAQQGTSNGVTATNTNTGADSTNTAQVGASKDSTTTVNNVAKDTTTAAATANTGGNTNSSNSGTSAVKTGDAGIAVTQVKNDNTTAINGSVGLSNTGYNGDVEGDLELSFANAVSLLTGEGGSRSIQAVNDTTGSGSSNDIVLSTAYNELTEVQNDGEIDNDLALDAITGQNQANMNTGDAHVTTGDANIAATLVNLLNTTVLNGALAIDVYDIFGNLNGNIVIPDLYQLATLLAGQQTTIDASNENTGSDSENTIDVNIDDTEKTNIKNDADINTNVVANAITGQNEASKNTGGGQVTTGDGSVQASNISVANTTVEGGNWALVIVNALNKWVGFLVGDTGEVKQLSQEETIREIEAQNSNTGSDSTNTIEINDTTTKITDIDNNARINNNVVANAITGQNEASKNTGGGLIETGNANVAATAVNIANTVVKNATLGIAVVNVFGDWIGDLLYGGQSLLAGLFGSGETSADVAGANTQTGSESNNAVNVTINKSQETNIDNNADIDTVLQANIDTGNNTADKNTGGGKIDTGNGALALHSRAVANITGVAGPGSLELDIVGENENTGVDSKNKIKAEINNERILNINNNANVSTVFPATANTGNNSASFNTGGGEITTGGIDASAAVSNLLNQVVLAMGGGIDLDDPSVAVDAELLNELTGALSENENDVLTTRNFLLGIFNAATVDTLLDFLFNTGSNAANANTGPVSINTGDICVNGQLVNHVNEVAGVGAAHGDIENTAGVTNQANVNADTGNNTQDMNTGGASQEHHQSGCEKIAKVSEEKQPEREVEQPVGGGEEDKGSDSDEHGVGGGEDADVPLIARIAGAKVAQAQDMKEDVVDKAAGISRLADTGIASRRPLLWALFTLASTLALVGAMQGDKQHRIRKLGYA